RLWDAVGHTSSPRSVESTASFFRDSHESFRRFGVYVKYNGVAIHDRIAPACTIPTSLRCSIKSKKDNREHRTNSSIACTKNSKDLRRSGCAGNDPAIHFNRQHLCMKSTCG